MRTKTILTYLLAGSIVLVLGALAGWYFFLRAQSGATASLNAARGFSAGTSASSPFGSNSVQPGTEGEAASSSPNLQTPPQLWQLSSGPAAGIGFATSSAGIEVTYVERSTGNVFAGDPTNGQITRLTNTLMPKIYEAIFSPGGRVYLRGLDASGVITTFAGVVPPSAATSSQALPGAFLQKGIEALAPDKKSGQIVYFAPSSGGLSLYRSLPDGTKQKQLFSSAFTDWRLSVLPDSRIVITEKAADGVNGYAFELPGSGVLNRLLGPLPGLTVLPRGSSSALLFGTSSGSGLSLFAQASASSSSVRLPVQTTADKCAWVPGTALIAYCAVPQAPAAGDFLDAWYRGEVHSSDAIWRIDVGAGQAQLFFSPEGAASLDVIEPQIDGSGSYLTFLNGADHAPWLLRLNK